MPAATIAVGCVKLTPIAIPRRLNMNVLENFPPNRAEVVRGIGLFPNCEDVANRRREEPVEHLDERGLADAPFAEQDDVLSPFKRALHHLGARGQRAGLASPTRWTPLPSWFEAVLDTQRDAGCLDATLSHA